MSNASYKEYPFLQFQKKTNPMLKHISSCNLDLLSTEKQVSLTNPFQHKNIRPQKTRKKKERLNGAYILLLFLFSSLVLLTSPVSMSEIIDYV